MNVVYEMKFSLVIYSYYYKDVIYHLIFAVWKKDGQYPFQYKWTLCLNYFFSLLVPVKHLEVQVSHSGLSTHQDRFFILFCLRLNIKFKNFKSSNLLIFLLYLNFSSVNPCFLLFKYTDKNILVTHSY